MTDTCLLFRLAMGHEPLFMYTLGIKFRTEELPVSLFVCHSAGKGAG